MLCCQVHFHIGTAPVPLAVGRSLLMINRLPLTALAVFDHLLQGCLLRRHIHPPAVIPAGDGHIRTITGMQSALPEDRIIFLFQAGHIFIHLRPIQGDVPGLIIHIQPVTEHISVNDFLVFPEIISNIDLCVFLGIR